MTNIDSDQLHIRHGALLALAEAILACKALIKSDLNLADSIITAVFDLHSTHGTYFNSFGSEIYREAFCRFVVCVCEAGISLPQKWIDLCWTLTESTLERKEEQLQVAAVDAYHALALYHGCTNEKLEKLIESVHPSRDAFARRGYALAIGRTPLLRLSKESFARCCQALIEASRLQMEQKQWNDAEARRNAVQGLTTLLLSTESQFYEFNTCESFELCLRAYLNGMSDYAVDSRGDVGSWIREACMIGLKRIVPVALSAEPAINIAIDLQKALFGKILQQSAEKIDKIRDCAGSVLMSLIYEVPQFHIAHRDLLMKTFPR